MRYRALLPVLQTAAMLLIVWWPWATKAHELDVIPENGVEVKFWALIPGPEAVDWAQAINLPAATAVIPIEFAARRGDALPNHKVRFYGFWLAGLLCWYMIGRLADDIQLWRRSGALPAKNPVDLTFALLAVPSAILLAAVFTFGSVDSPVLAVWGAIWLVLSSTALLFRSWQYIKQRQRPQAS